MTRVTEAQTAVNLDRSGIQALVAERQELNAEKKELEAKISKLNVKIMKVLAKNDVLSCQVGEYRVTMVVEATYEKFDRGKFIRYLVERRVKPTLLAEAEAYAVEVTPKAPHLRISGGGGE